MTTNGVGILFSFRCIDTVIMECLCLDRTPDDMRETADLVYQTDLARLQYNTAESFFCINPELAENLERKAYGLLSRRRRRSQAASQPA